MESKNVLKISILGKETIHCGYHLVPYIVSTVTSKLVASSYVLITDTNVAKYHLKKFQDEFDARLAQFQGDARPRFFSHVISPGELSKTREVKAAIEDVLLSVKCTRDTVILALGGGVIGDTVGFVAATFMRGVRFVQIPTTLLAMVDSSVGGKTGVDTPDGKNLIGAFWQPEYIFVDAAFLATLPIREFSNGMAEVIKAAAIWNHEEFAALESSPSELFAAIKSLQTQSSAPGMDTPLTSAQSLLLSVIVNAMAVKVHVVTADERESGLRNLLNFGHSIGHAIEAVLAPSILHGECVSIGMIIEAEIARHMGILSQVNVGRLTTCLHAYDLPVSMTDSRISAVPPARLLSAERILDFMKIDKKNNGTVKKIVLLSRIGATYELKAMAVSDEIIFKVLATAVKIVPGSPARSPVRMTTPGSKSVSNRALILAALGKGTCRLKNLLFSEDTQVMMNALNELKGAKFVWEDNGETLVVEGGGGSLCAAAPGKELYVANAGTTARFLTTVCTLVRFPSSEKPDLPMTDTVIDGNARMRVRPIGPLVDALRSNGSNIKYLGSTGYLPLSISPNGLKGGHIRLAANLSSQYVSSVLLCAPYASEPVILELTGGKVISQWYIDMTIKMMQTFGVSVRRRSDPATGELLDIYDIPIGAYTNPHVYVIECDASSATYPLAIAAITGTTCTIENIGSASLQGDALFAKVLEKMGCEVLQTENETTVTGPPLGKLKAIGEVDMEVMTDAFLTASVLAAVAGGDKPGGTTRILGIANQRVKECDRIKAMVDQLRKFGVDAKELDDGLEISGKPISRLIEDVNVHCYNDHRVAMSFSVLGTIVKGTVIEDRRCVEKTWPSWWDELEKNIGFKLEGIDPPRSSLTHTSTTRDPSASVFLIGMRGIGKTYVGKLAAASLGWKFLDADEYFEEKHKIGVRDFVHQRGWPAFRAAEIESLSYIVEANPTKHVISLGGGVVETAAARKMLKDYTDRGLVVNIVRPVEEGLHYLGEEKARPAYGEPIVDVFNRRQPWFAECSSHEFINVTTCRSLTQDIQSSPDATLRAKKASQNEIHRFFAHITGQQSNLAPNLAPGRRSYFLSINQHDVTQVLPHIERVTVGIDAVEIRVDCLRNLQSYGSLERNIPSKSYVADQIAAVRRETHLPIIFTVRTVTQGGAFPDDAEAEAFDLMHLALRLGVEYVDVEISWSAKRIFELLSQKGPSKIIASWHDATGNTKWNGSLIQEKYQLAYQFGDIVKLVCSANDVGDNLDLFSFVSQVSSAPNAKPIIALNMGPKGQLSRILCSTFSPCSHPLLPKKAAPGQLSFAEIQTGLHLLGLLPARRFFLFGSSISKSMSPTLHNTAFKLFGLPHTYELFQTSTVGEEIKSTIASLDFGGASVTIPFKLDVIPLLDKLSPAAQAIGAVNTIISRDSETEGSGRILLGDNTDWKGIRESVCANRPFDWPIEAALVIGAGGTARAAIYALHDLGAKRIYVFNRTASRAHSLASDFPDFGVEVLNTLGKWSVAPSVIISSVPASATTTAKDGPKESVYLPSSLFGAKQGVVVDMAYTPSDTPVISLAKSVGGKTWAIVPGIDVLLEQGYVQFQLWTGFRCPKKLVREQVMKKFLVDT